MATIDYSSYSSVFFIDSMVPLEAKPLQNLPWSELDLVGPILLLVVPQVNAEIDKRKRDGRLALRARAFNRLIVSAAESGRAIRLVEGTPSVDIAIAICDRIDWSKQDLDPDSGDARVVAEVLSARGLSTSKKALLTYDINPMAMAIRSGLKAIKLPDHWLIEPEPSPQDKEVTKLKGRVKELEATEPKLDHSLKFGATGPLQLYQVAPLPERRQEEMCRRILRANPQEMPRRREFVLSPIDYDAQYDKRYQKYRNSVRLFASTLHSRIECQFSQIPFSLNLSNNGYVAAEHLIVRVDAIGGTIGKKFALYSTNPPVAPEPEFYPFMPDLPNLLPAKPIGRHEMNYVSGMSHGVSIEVQCADFRQGRSWTLEGVAMIDVHTKTAFRLDVELTAFNLHGAIKQTYELQWTSKNVECDELLDLSTYKQLLPIPMRRQLDEAIQDRDWDWFQTIEDGNEDEDDS